MIPLRQQTLWIRRLQKALAGVSVCGLAAFYFVAYRPSMQRQNELRLAIAAADASIGRNQEAARDLDAIKTDVRRLGEKILRSRQLPTQEDQPKFIREIQDLSHGVSLQKFDYKPQKNRQLELCGELPIDLTFVGSFPDVAAFLRQAEEMPRMLRTRKLHLSSKNGKTGDVDVKLSMSIFYADAK
jgi:Tfp pilus assembly protein PilO